QRLEQLTVRRERREPLQLILGRAPFRRLMLDVEPGVFIPRPETELALDLLREHTTGPLTEVVDLCAGSGALGAAVLDEITGARARGRDRPRRRGPDAEEPRPGGPGPRPRARGRSLRRGARARGGRARRCGAVESPLHPARGRAPRRRGARARSPPRPVRRRA